ncbi:MAG: AI-2E family transporter [Planctomycetaceae bacterium]
MTPPAVHTELDRSHQPALRVLLTWASLVVIVAGMKAAAALVVPFLLALFLAILSGPPLQWLYNRRIPQWLALLIVIAGLCVIVMVLAVAAKSALVQFQGDLTAAAVNVAEPAFPSGDEPRVGAISLALNRRIDEVIAANSWMVRIGIDEWLERLKIDPSVDGDPGWSRWLEPDAIMQQFTKAMLAASGLLSQTFLILITTLFLIVEAATLPDKLRLIAGDSTRHMQELRRIAHDVNGYMAIKTSTSLLTGGLVFMGLWLFGIQNAFLLGLLAFLLNYVPNIGSILAAVPAVLMALWQAGLGTVAAVVMLYVAVNLVIGYFIEPRWMGKGLGLSTLVVFVSLVFWGWVLGPVGMVISVPLTMTVKIALENSEDTRWLAILMGPAVGSSGKS